MNAVEGDAVSGEDQVHQQFDQLHQQLAQIASGGLVSLEGPYTNEQLLASARDYAFNGLLNITALTDEIVELRRDLRNHFSEILKLIDGAKE